MHISFFNKFIKILVDLIFIALILIRSQLTHTYPRFTQRFFIRCCTSIALRTSKTSQYDSSHNIHFFFHIGACPFSSFEICWLPRPFPNTTWTSFIIEKTRFPSRNIGSARVFGSLWNISLSFWRGASREEINDGPYTRPSDNFSDKSYRFHLNNGCRPDIPYLTALTGC